MSAWIETSSAATLSSAMRKRGSETSALAMEMRWRWPPEKAWGNRLRCSTLRRPARRDLAHAFVGFLAGRGQLHNLERLGDDVPDGHARAQGGVRILKDQLRLLAVGLEILAFQGRDVEATVACVEAYAAGADRRRLQYGAAERRLARAAFSDQAEEVTAGDIERHAFKRLEHRRFADQAGAERIVDAKIADGNDGVTHSAAASISISRNKQAALWFSASATSSGVWLAQSAPSATGQRV